MKGISVNSFMYADDLIILSASMFDMQKLLNLCTCELNDILLRVNLKKCACIRIGKRFNAHCEQLSVAQEHIAFADQIRYLGVYIKTGHALKFNTDSSKGKFYGCMNEILHKVGSRETVAISLCNSYCVPMLLYAVEAMHLTKTEKLRLSSPFNRLFSKLFKSFDRSVVQQCQYYMSCLPLDYVIDLRHCKFLFKLQSIDNNFIKLFADTANRDLTEICLKYNLNVNNTKSWRHTLWSSFARLIESSV